MTIFVLFIFIVALLFGLPLYIFLFGLSMYLFTTVEQLPLISAVISFQKLQSQEFIAAIPLFTFAGYVLSKSKSPDRIVNAFQKSFSFIPGSSGALVLIVMALFTALTGASGVSILALGGLMYPLLKNSGKTESFSLGLITSSGSIGLLFASSLPVIIYAIVASQNLANGSVDINSLFKVALLPSIILIGVLVIYSSFAGKKQENFNLEAFCFKDMLVALKDAKFEIPLPIIVYGGIYSGLFTVMEASIVTAFYVFLIEFVIYKDLSLTKDFGTTVVESMKLAGGIFIIMATAFILTNYLVDQEIPKKAFEAISPYIQSRTMFLLFVNVFLLICGCLLDIFSAVLIVLPILIPIVEKYAIDPYHFAIIFLINLEIGYLTPPVGMNLFISSYRFKKPITQLYKSCFPFLILMVGILLLVTYMPALSSFSLGGNKHPSKFDITPPGEVSQWRVEELGSDFVHLQFKAVGDDGLKGKVHLYDMRYLDEDILNEDDFEYSEEVIWNEDIVLSGEWQNIIIDSLEPGTDYWFALKAQDEIGNQSPRSKSFKITTLANKAE